MWEWIVSLTLTAHCTHLPAMWKTEWEYFRLAHFLLSAHDSLSPSLVGKECLCICFFLIALPSNLTIHYNTEIYLFWLHWGCQRLLKVICKLFKSQTFLTLSVCLEMYGFFLWGLFCGLQSFLVVFLSSLWHTTLNWEQNQKITFS